MDSDLIVLLRASKYADSLSRAEASRAPERREREKEKDVEWTTAGQCCDGIKIVDLHENER